MNTNQGNASEVFRAFLLLGLTSFGGPVAHLGFFRAEFVARRRWLDDAAYSDLVALCQFLPGPASSQVGIAIGRLRAGYPGAKAAFVGFTLPSVVLLLAFAYGATSLAGPAATGALHGLKVAALAVVAQAVWAMSKSLTPDWPRRTLALLAAAIALLLPSSTTQVALIAIAAVAGFAIHRGEAAPRLHFNRTAAAFLSVFVALLVALPLLALSGNPVLVVIEKFYRTGSLVFGGGHVVLPLLEAELVDPGLIGRDLFLAGYGAAQAVPGPSSPLPPTPVRCCRARRTASPVQYWPWSPSTCPRFCWSLAPCLIGRPSGPTRKCEAAWTWPTRLSSDCCSQLFTTRYS